MLNVSAEDVLSHIRAHVTHSAEDLFVFWLRSDGNRERLREQIEAERRDDLVVPIVMRESLFQNPNSVSSDIASVLELHRATIESAMAAARDNRLSLVLISKTALGVPQASSPVMAPDWLPRGGGRLLNASVHDVLHSMQGLIDSPAADVVGLRQCLFELDGALWSRLDRQAVRAPKTIKPLWEQIRTSSEKAKTFDVFLREAKGQRAAVSSGQGYRPPIGPYGGVVGRLAALAADSTVGELGRAGAVLAAALGGPFCDATARETTLLGILIGAPAPEREPRLRSGRDLLVLCYTLHRWIIAAGHAAEYKAFPVDTLEALSRHLKERCSDTIGLLLQD
jgi:hypothetical protein